DADGLTVSELASQPSNCFTGGFATPVLTLPSEALDLRCDILASCAESRGVVFAPLPEAILSPRLFERRLTGALWGVTAVTPVQARAARAAGIQRILLDSPVVDPVTLGWIARELDTDPGFRFICFTDSVRGVELMDAALRTAGATRPTDVVIQLSAGEGPRAGIRSIDQGEALANAVAKTRTLRLVGVAGCEDDVPVADQAAVATWLKQLLALAASLDRAGHFSAVDEIVVSVNGGTWFDAVTDEFAEMSCLSRPLLKLIRSGRPVTRDSEIMSASRAAASRSMTPLRLWAQIISCPEPGRAVANVGTQDLTSPDTVTAHFVRAHGDSQSRLVSGITLSHLTHQHAWLDVADGTRLNVGDWIALSVSSPAPTSTGQYIPVATPDGTVTDYIRPLV
ncbi:amino acid deaminase, partial [Streptomyces formicae]